MLLYKLVTIAKPADIILISGEGFISKLIKYAQKPFTLNGKPSLWSHAALYVNEQTVWESTIDTKTYRKTGKRLDNGVQFNGLSKYEHIKTAMLVSMPALTDNDRDAMLEHMTDMEREGYTYPITGLLGSLLSYWLFGWRSNPLQSKRSLYCSAAVQETYSVKGIDFDPKHTARNTCPEMIYQYEPSVKTWL